MTTFALISATTLVLQCSGQESGGLLWEAEVSDFALSFAGGGVVANDGPFTGSIIDEVRSSDDGKVCILASFEQYPNAELQFTLSSDRKSAEWLLVEQSGIDGQWVLTSKGSARCEEQMDTKVYSE